MKNWKSRMLMLIGVCLSLQFSYSQNQVFNWVKRMGGSSNDFANDMVMDQSGNIYITGYFSGTNDFDPSSSQFPVSSNGVDDIFVAKYNTDGSLAWAKNIGGSDSDQGRGVDVDASGNVYVTGYFKGSVDFDPGNGTYNLSSIAGKDIFALKLDSQGEFVWAGVMGGSRNTEGYDIKVDANQNIHLTGFINGTADLEPGPGVTNVVSNGSRDVFVVKLDATYNLVWAKNMGGNSGDTPEALEIDDAGNVYTTGTFLEIADFDPGTRVYNLTANSTTLNDCFISKLDADGNFVWVKQLGGQSDDVGTAIEVKGADLVVTGRYSGVGEFNPNIGVQTFVSEGQYDAFLVKLDTAGNYHWAKSFGGINYDYGMEVGIDEQGNVYAVGQFVQEASFGEGANEIELNTTSYTDGYVCKLSSNGDVEWVKSYGGDAYAAVYMSGVATRGNDVIMYGYFSNTVDFNSGEGTKELTSFGGTDLFLSKLGECSTTYGTDEITSCESYTWIDGNTYTSSNNSATHTLVNQAGCDSVVTLDLTINNSSSGVDIINACDSYTWINGVTYTSSNYSDTYTLMNAEGCDSVVTLNLTLTVVDTEVIEEQGGLEATATNASFQWIDCDDNQTIDGATDSFFEPLNSGSYAVKVTQGECFDTSSCYSYTTVGLKESLSQSAIQVYPNPTSNNLYIQSEKELNEIVVYSSIGTKVVHQVEPGINVVDVSNLAKGVYVIEVNIKGEVIRKRFFKD